MDRLDLGVTRGIITQEQRDALRALDVESAEGAVEARHGLNGVTVAYWTGGIAVLSAFGWFLISRWTVLGPSGVLAVSVVYAVLFATMARVLARQGFRYAAAVSTVLVVGMVPVVTWALLALSGWWTPYALRSQRYAFTAVDPLWDQLRWLPIDLATILAALVALRRVKLGILALPIAAGMIAAAGHGIVLFMDIDFANALGGRLPLLLAVVMLSVAYALDTRQPEGEDYAIWFYLAGLGALATSMAGFWSESSKIAAHTTLALSFILAYAALRLRRRLLLLAALLGFVVYLSYLAFDVFKNTLEFPVALATVGITVILLAVWVQRKFPSLVHVTAPARSRRIPGAWLALAGAGIISVVMIVEGVPGARQRIAERYWREGFERRRMHNLQKYRERYPQPRGRRVRPTAPPPRP